MTFTPQEIFAFIIGIFGFVLTVLNIIEKKNNMQTKASEPFNTLKSKVDAHEVEISDIKFALKQGNDRFREQDETNEVLIHSVLALIEFEIQYCLTEHKDPSKDLERAKDDLHHFLSKR